MTEQIIINGRPYYTAELEHYTPDLERFADHLPTIEKLNQHAPGTPAWQAIVYAVEDREGLAATLQELARFQQDKGRECLALVK